ncbi:unnamed protein product, partial [Symbiodinium necroappetens]
ASGPDGLPGEAFKALPASLSSLVLPLVLKLGLLGEEGAGLKGGRKGASAVFGSHLTRAFVQWCSVHKQPACILYADVASAYYNSVRDITAQRLDVDGRPVDSLAVANLPADVNVADALASGSAFRSNGASPWLESLAAEMHRGSWFALRGDHIPVVTHRGSRPGSSLADIMYSAGVGCILAKRDALRTADPTAGRVPRIPWDGRRDISPADAPTQWPSLSEVIWADDLAEFFLLSDSARAAHQVGLEASFLDEAFGSHGYTLTYGTSKTAAMVLLGGRGSKAAKRALFGRAGVITVVREHHPAASLPLVAQYKHLGVMVGTSFLTELRARCASAWAAFRQGRVRAYRCRRISVARRGALLRAMVLPRLLFGAGAWPSLRQGERTLFHRTLVSMYRQTLCIPRTEDQHITGATMCALLHLPDPTTVLRVERLRYLRQMVQAAPDALWALVSYFGLPLMLPFKLVIAFSLISALKVHGYRTRATETTRGCQQEPDCHPGLLAALLELDAGDESVAWEAVADFIAPLEHLRCTVRAWRAHANAQSFAPEVATNLLLLLDPDLCCDSFPQPRPRPAVVDFLAPFPPLRGLALPVAQTGAPSFWDIDPPPLPSFVYPFDSSAPLAAASRHVAWLEATTDVVLQAVQMSLEHPVSIRAPPAALRCLEPLSSWLRDGGLPFDG